MNKKFLLFLFPFSSVFALPENPHLVQGSSAIQKENGTLLVQAGDSTIINWQSFSLASNETARFVLPHANARILNRVTGIAKSEILGRLVSNGRFYLINPNGILIGPNSVIDTKSALFSTLELSNESFLRGEELRFVGASAEGIEQFGDIFAEEDLILVSRKIENCGSIQAGSSIALAAAEEVLIRPAKDSFYIRLVQGQGEIVNKGNLRALQVELLAQGNPYSFAIQQSGRIDASQAVKRGGRIYLTAFQGNADISGELLADGGGQGDGGKIVLIGENNLSFSGSASAKGGEEGGEGGFIEISGHRGFDYHPTSVTTFAPQGKTGTLLLDPNDIIIQAAAATSGGFANPYTGATFSPALLQISDLIGAAGLQNNAVTVQTSAATAGGSGDITVQDSFSWSSGNTLTLLPSRDLNVKAVMQATGGGAVVVNAGRTINVGTQPGTTATAIQTNSGNITLTTVQDLNLIGGSVPAATALITSSSGLITSTIGGNVTIGASSLPFSEAFAELSSTTGNVIFNNIGGNLTLTGGSLAGAYAQIGKGNVPGSTAVVSSLTFTSITGDTVLTGGSASGAYAQIGHAPNGGGTSSAAGDIIFPPSIGAMGAVTLTGGGDNSSAIIGHGNELSANLNTASGTINLGAFNGFTLQGGNATGSHAIIGFHNPQGGAGTFNCTSPGITVQNFIQNDIILNAGSGSNAVIGYYNNSLIGGGTNVTISLIDVENENNLNIRLNAGDSLGGSNGVAAVGTLASAGTAQSAINMATGKFFSNSTAPVGDGSVRIVNCLPGTSVPYDVTIHGLGVGPVATFLGGTTSASNFTELYSGQNLNVNCEGDLIVNQIGQTGFVQLRGYQSVFLNKNIFGGNVTLTGSSTASTGYALIRALQSSVWFGNTLGAGGSDITLGDPTSVASSQIISESGTSILNTLGGGAFTLSAGTGGAMPIAAISSNSGAINIQSKNMTLSGGSGALAYAQIASNTGDVTISSNTMTLNGGSAVQAYAQIGKGYITTETAIASNLNITEVRGSIILQGGSAMGAYAQIGHSPFNNTGSLDVSGNLNFSPFGVTNSVSLTGGSATNATAIIGHGNELSSHMGTCTGNISSFMVSNDVTLQAGTVPQTHAIIGYHNPTGGSASFFQVIANNPGIQLSSISGQMMLTATNGSNAAIGYYNPTNTGAASVAIATLSVTCNNNITLQAGNDGGTGAGVAVIGTLANSGSTATSAIQLRGNTVSLLGPTGGLGSNNGSARIVNNLPNTSAPFDINMTVTDLLVFGGTGDSTGFADVYSSENLTCLFSNNLEVNSTTLQNGYAHVVSYQDMNLGSTGNQLSVTGGALFSADALIESLQGNITHGSYPFSGVFNVLVGNATSFSTSQILTTPGRNTINSLSDMTIQGGAAANCVSLIGTGSGSFAISSGGNMKLTGGTGGSAASAEIRSLSGSGQVASNFNLTLQGGGNPLCFAQINSDTGPVTFTQIGGNLTLTGGSGSQTYAQIGKGSVASATFVSSALTFTSIGGNVTLNGSGASGSYAQIGHSPFGGTQSINVAGNIAIQNIGGTLSLNGGTGLDTTAIIGHGNELTTRIANCSGTITVFNNGIGGIVFTPGATNLNTHAVIGFHSPAAGPAMGVTFAATSGLIDVETRLGPIQINGGVGENAIIGYYNATTPATLPPGVNVLLSNLTVKCSTNQSATNNITLQAGNTSAGINGVAIIGTTVATGSTALSSINIAGNILNVFGPTGTNDGQAYVTNDVISGINPHGVAISTNTTTVRGGTSTSVSGNALAEIYSCGPLTCNFTTALNVGINPASSATLQTVNSFIRAFGDITMNQNGSTGNVIVLGGASTTVQTDISSKAGAVNIGLTGYPGANNITIGRSDMLGSARIFTVTDAVNVYAGGSLFLTGGSSSAAIAALSANSSCIYNSNGGAITILGGSDPSAIGRLSASSGFLTATAKNGITLTGNAAFAEIRNFGFENQSIGVNSGSDITLNTTSRILNGGSGQTGVTAQNNLTLNADGLIQNAGNGNLYTFSGVSTFLNGTSQIRAAGGNLFVIVDALYPTPPGMGSGQFVTQAGATVASNSLVRIFTATQLQNDIESPINAATYVPGIEFVDTATEQWHTYYPSSFGGIPFTIFYKDFIPNVAPIIVMNTIANVEFQQTLLSYDDLIMNMHEMTTSYQNKNDKPQKRRPLTHLLPRAKYQFLRQSHRDYNLKKLDLLN